MSTILKALRRLEQEKSAQSDRPLGEAVANTPAPPAATRGIPPWLVAGVSIVVAFSATVAAFWILSSDDPAPPAEIVAAAETGAEAAARPRATKRPEQARPEIAARREAAKRAQAARAKRNAERVAVELPTAALASDVAVVAPAAKAPTEAADEPAAPPPVREIPNQAPPRPGLAALRPDMTGIVPTPVSPSGERTAPPERSMPTPQEIEEYAAARAAGEPVPELVVAAREAPRIPAAPAPPQTPAPAVVAPPAPTPEVVAAVVEAPKPRATASPPRKEAEPARKAPVAEAPAAKPVASKPVVSKRKTAPPPEPEVFVASTVWHPIADRRVAVVEYGGNGEAIEVREGDLIGPLVVGEIEPTGVYFTNNGAELRRRVGER